MQDPSDRNLSRWTGEGSFVIPSISATLTHGIFYVSLYSTYKGQYKKEIEYTKEVSFDYSDHVYQLSRVFEQESGPSINDKKAIAHVIYNRLTRNEPSRQVDTSSPWPVNYIETAFGINRGRPRADWTEVTSAASRVLANIIIQNNGPIGSDPTHNAIYYLATAHRDRLEARAGIFSVLKTRVDTGQVRRYEIGNHTFYGEP